MKNKWIYIVAIFLFSWSISGQLSLPSIAVAGLVTLALVLTGFIDIKGTTHKQVKVTGLWIRFLGLLIKEVVLANFQVARIVLSNQMAIRPHVKTWTTQLKSEGLQTILANAITLTPGTMSVDIKGQVLSVHCLHDEAAETLEGWALESYLVDIEEAVHG